MAPVVAQCLAQSVDPGLIIWLVIIAIFTISNMLKAGKKKAAQQGRTGGARPQPPPLRRSAARRPTDVDARLQQARERTEQRKRPKKEEQVQARRTSPSSGGGVQMRGPRAGSPSPRPPVRRPTMEEQMRQLYEQMTGQPAAPKAPPPRPQSPPPPDPRMRIKQPAVKPAPEPLIENPYSDSAFGTIEDIEEIKELLTSDEGMASHTGGAHNIMGTRSMLIELGKLNLPLMRIPIMPMDTVDNVQAKPNLKNRNILRNAVLSRVLLEPPKALQDSPNEDANHI